MTPAAVIDTHAVIWYLNADACLSFRAKTFIDDAGNQGSAVLVSSISLVEIIYLQEKSRAPRGVFPGASNLEMRTLPFK